MDMEAAMELLPDDGWLGGDVVFKSAMTRWRDERASLLSAPEDGAGDPDGCLDLAPSFE